MKWLLMILCSLMVVGESMAMGEPLFIVNGKEVSKSEFERLDPQALDDIKVLKDVESVKPYGEKGAYGVILVTLKYDTPPIFSQEQSFKEYLTQHVKWKDDEMLSSVWLKYKIKRDGSMELIAIEDATSPRFKRRVMKAFDESPAWQSPAMNMGEVVEMEGSLSIELPENKVIIIR